LVAVGRCEALIEQARSDVFTMSVGNLPPHEEATVRVVYSERLPFFDLDSLAPSVTPDLLGGRSTMVAFRAATPQAVRVRGSRREIGSPSLAVIPPSRSGVPDALTRRCGPVWHRRGGG